MKAWLILVITVAISTVVTLTTTLIFNSIVNGAKRRKKDAELIAAEVTKKDEVVKRGLQALLRHELYELYNKYYHLGWAPLDVKNDFENIYLGYHNLGKNGVMDGMHDRFMQLPEKASRDSLLEDKKEGK